MDAKKLISITGAVVVVGVLIWVDLGRRAKNSDSIQTEILEVLTTMECYSQHEEFLRAHTDAAHERAFSASYSSGSRRRSARLNEARYVDFFFTDLIAAAKQAQKADLVEALGKLKGEMEVLVERGED